MLVEDVFDFPGKGTVITSNVLKDRWDVDEPSSKNAKGIEIAGQRYDLLQWGYFTNKFHNCSTGWPTNYATIGLSPEGHFPRGPFKHGTPITLCDRGSVCPRECRPQVAAGSGRIDRSASRRNRS